MSESHTVLGERRPVLTGMVLDVQLAHPSTERADCTPLLARYILRTFGFGTGNDQQK